MELVNGPPHPLQSVTTIQLVWKKEITFPHSLGLLYSAFTSFCGFKVNSGEYKLMGLAPYGEPKYSQLIKDNLIDIKQDGSFCLNLEYFGYLSDLQMTNDRFASLFGHQPRLPDGEELTQFHMDMASSIQSVTEEVVLKIAIDLRKQTGLRKICLAGGVALNCVANGRLHREAGYGDNIWIQPAAGDAGGAVGSALAYWHMGLGGKRQIKRPDAMKSAFLGPSFKNSEIEKTLQAKQAVFEKLEYKILIPKVAKLLSTGCAIGWFQGAMEFGPRALGGRSILADPRSASTQKDLNLKIKYRESFRPFAPIALEEKASAWFKDVMPSPYMLFVTHIKEEHRLNQENQGERLFGIDLLNVPKSTVPAITHVDYSTRLQTVNKSDNELMHWLLCEFEKITGTPILVNTSFNVRGEPIVCNPEDAFHCFMGTDLDYLVVGNYLLDKKSQVASFKDYKDTFELD